MKKKYRNGFFIFGLVLLGLMMTQLDFQQVWDGLAHAGYWFLAVLLLWFFLYFFNTTSWYIIIRSTIQPSYAQSSSLTAQPSLSNAQPKVPYFWLYKVMVSGFALNYATPGGLMGGEPYRIMELSSYIGTERASSSVILHTMTHIFSHLWFWLLSVLLFIITEPMTPFMAAILAAVTAFCILGIWFFMKGYKKGLANRAFAFLSHIPGAKKWAKRFIDKHHDELDNIDIQIAALHKQNPRTFHGALLLELACRFLSALEIYFILLVIMPSADYIQCVLILAFTSLFANILFFMPLQIGGREGGFMMSTSGLALTPSAGIFVALIVRIRELFWTAIGMFLINVGRRKTNH
ncbi:MAG: lysylphosphatidylglycerol synthase transmembrane domain-containing protein [Prevotella sp.]|uniref:lysylphosphatidylglycerol synthase transmembrane domain-containing protein n=1 Tax=Prevotella sp. TaxID=59823 RepID=UPI002A2AC524|nr:lysylphosphatidylglycerol synthase transmembrane domain-containing protein [Prevotella sp.]MDD7317638.1 lysylphosphatidylglycerol synthase transmembrane domain-containing protein [Prevotellaceae bacterium]MDY4020515.1 lysylphosphatidylglycerol synthase transmembrane domain-containing protein [Prevotella sp.]